MTDIQETILPGVGVSIVIAARWVEPIIPGRQARREAQAAAGEGAGAG
jgi:hypothetical protein